MTPLDLHILRHRHPQPKGQTSPLSPVMRLVGVIGNAAWSPPGSPGGVNEDRLHLGVDRPELVGRPCLVHGIELGWDPQQELLPFSGHGYALSD